MHAKVSPNGLRFFSHDAAQSDCPTAGESLAHRLLKLELVSAARAAGWEAELEVAGEAGDIPVISLSAAARESFDSRELTGPEATAVGYGQRIPSSQAGRPQPIAAFGPKGNLVAMLDESGTLAKAHVVFSPSGS